MMNHFLSLTVLLLVLVSSASAQWLKQTVNTSASFRGLSVVDQNVVWASGTGGTVIRTVDGGKTWNLMAIPAAEKLDFRDIEAFDANTAYILSIGNGDSSRIYRTDDGGATWKLQFTNSDPKKFFDGIACWDRDNCIAVSDPVEGVFPLIFTRDGGSTWSPLVTKTPLAAKEGEAAFAASGTCLIAQGQATAFLVTGGSDSRVFRTTDRGQTWDVNETTIIRGTSGSGAFSIAMWDTSSGYVVGGDYEHPADTMMTSSYTIDGGRTWAQGTRVNGYRSGVTYLDAKTLIAVGTSGSDISTNGGDTWRVLDKSNWNAVQAKGADAVWAVGPKGLVGKLDLKEKNVRTKPSRIR